MKGASTEPWAKISNPPNRISTMMSGASQNFLRARMYAHKSENKSNMTYAVASAEPADTIHDCAISTRAARGQRGRA